MPSKQIGNVLQDVQSAQRSFAARCVEIAGESQDPRVAFLLEYLSRQEQRLNDVIDSYDEELGDGILETWVQFVDEDKLTRVAADTPLSIESTPAEVVEATLAFDEAVLELYEEVAESTSAPDVEELFTSLANMEEAARRQFARATLDI